MEMLRQYFHQQMPNASEDDIEAEVVRVWYNDDEYFQTLNQMFDNHYL